jgi:shikimate dehydrogenase
VWNRTSARAEALCEQFTMMAQQCSVELLALDAEQSVAPWDLVINATAASLNGELPELPDATIARAAACYDMAYGAQPTIFLNWAQALGVAQRWDGLGMLVGQAAESFYLWTGQRPICEPVLAEIRQTIRP